MIPEEIWAQEPHYSSKTGIFSVEKFPYSTFFDPWFLRVLPKLNFTVSAGSRRRIIAPAPSGAGIKVLYVAITHDEAEKISTILRRDMDIELLPTFNFPPPLC